MISLKLKIKPDREPAKASEIRARSWPFCRINESDSPVLRGVLVEDGPVSKPMRQISRRARSISDPLWTNDSPEGRPCPVDCSSQRHWVSLVLLVVGVRSSDKISGSAFFVYIYVARNRQLRRPRRTMCMCGYARRAVFIICIPATSDSNVHKTCRINMQDVCGTQASFVIPDMTQSREMTRACG